MRRLVMLTALALLALAPSAQGKEVVSVKACGPNDCVTTTDRDVLTAIMNGGPPSVPPGKGRVVTLRASVAEGPNGKIMGRFSLAWVPRYRMLVGEDGTWMHVSKRSATAIDGVVTGLGTFPPSKLDRLAPAAQTAGDDAPLTPADDEVMTPIAPAQQAARDDGFDWLLVLIPGAAAIALGGLVFLAVRRRRPGAGGAPRPAAP